MTVERKYPSDIAFTPTVKAIQQRKGSRASYERMEAGRGWSTAITPDLADFIAAYNFGRRLQTLKGLTPYEAISKAWLREPHRFTSDPTHQIPGPNI